MTKVSVIIPTYNRMGMVMHAIRSVLIQSYDDLEVLVIDDGSSDDTQLVVNSIDDARLHYIYQANAGLPAARNTGIRNAQGEYIAFLDDDDLWDAGKLAPQVALLEANPEIGLVAVGWRNIREDGSLIIESRPWLAVPKLTLTTWLYACPMIVNAALVRKEWLNIVYGFDENLEIFEDWDLWLRLAAQGCLMAWMDQVSCAYRIHDSSMVRGIGQMRSSMLRILDKFFSRTDLLPEIVAQRAIVYGRAYLRLAIRAMGVGQINEAQENIRTAVQSSPELLVNQGDLLIKNLLEIGNNPTIFEEKELFIDALYEALPEELCQKYNLPKKFRIYIKREEFYQAYQKSDWHEVRRIFWELLIIDPKFPKDRGPWSMMLKAILGKKNVLWVRNIKWFI